MAELIFFPHNITSKLLNDSRSFLGIEPANKSVVSNPTDTSTDKGENRVNVVREVRSW